MNKKNSRESGIDILRCIALFFVTLRHSFRYNGFYFVAQQGAMVWLADSVRWMSFCCVALFLLITGYLKSTKTINRDWFWSLIPILVSYTLTCCVSFPVQHFLLGEKYSAKEWLILFINFGNYAWYVEMYIGLMLLAPAINMVFDRLEHPRHILIAVGIMVLVTAVPSLTVYPIAPDYWVDAYPLTYYVIGAAIRKLQPRITIKRGAFYTGILMLGMGAVSVLTTDGAFDESFQYNNGFWVTCLSTVIFVTMYKIKLTDKAQNIIAWMAGGCFEGYLLSRLFDVWVYDLVPQWHNPENYLWMVLFITIPVFLLSVVLGKMIHTITLKIMKPINEARMYIIKKFKV